MSKFLISWISSGEVMVEAEDEDAAKALVAAAVKDRRLKPKLTLNARDLDEIQMIES